MKIGKYLDWFQVSGFIISILLSIYLIRIGQDDVISWLIGLSSAILIQLFDLQIRMGNSTEKVIDSFGNIADSQILGLKEFGKSLVPSLTNANHYVLDTALNEMTHELDLPSYFLGNQGDYRKLLYEKSKSRKISFQRVEVIFDSEKLERVIFRLLLHKGCQYFVRHYYAPPTSIPLMNMMSFDGNEFYLGGFYQKEAAGEEQVLFIREKHISDYFEIYWKILWDEAIPLNERGNIDWDELKRIGKNFGISKKAFNTLVKKVEADVEREIAQSNL